MARGWESKAIESQQQEATRGQAASGRQMTPEEKAREDRRRTLQLARARAVADLHKAQAPTHRSMLERTIAALDDQLKGL